MRKFLTLVALSSAMAIAGGVASVSSAKAATLLSGVHALKVEQANIAEKAYYYHRRHRHWHHRHWHHRHCWWHHGHRHCRWW
jgi:hypothetical protein